MLSRINRMNFHIADTFTDSLSRLTGGDQKAVKMINHLGHQPMKGFKA